jgi:hypothetical protein
MSHRRHLVFEDGLVIYHRYLFLCNNNLCAALLLLQFEEGQLIEEEVAQMDGREERPVIYTLMSITKKLYSLFTYTTINEAQNLLIEKGYIQANWYSQQKERPQEQRPYVITIQHSMVTQASQSYYEAHQACYPSQRTPAPASPARERHMKLEQKYQTEAARVNYHLNQAREQGLPATLTLEQWLQTLNDFQWNCAYCSSSYTLLEHFVPLVLGRGTVHTNCIPACRSCNTEKGSHYPTLVPIECGMSNAIQKVQQYLEGKEVQ